MKYTISERTITVETTQPGEALTGDTIRAVTGRKVTWDDVKAEAQLLTGPSLDEAYDPLEGIRYPETPADLLAMEPANILPAE